MIEQLFVILAKLFTGVQARWEGSGPEFQQRVYFANHTSNLDLVVLWSVLPTEIRKQTRPVAARDYWESNPVRHYLAKNVFRAVLIERKKVSRSTNPLELMLSALRGGESLILFPEGGRSMESEMRSFKSGLYHLAREMPDLAMVPVFIDNANRVLPKGEFLPIPFVCSVTFGRSMKILPTESKVDFLTRARQAIIDCSRL